MEFVSRQTRLNRLSSGNKSLSVPILEQMDAWMFLWDIFAGAAVQKGRHCNSTSKTYLCWEGREMLFLLSFRKLVLKQRLEVSGMAKKMHPPLQFHWMKGAAALSHSALTDRGGNGARHWHWCHPQSSTPSLPKLWTASVTERKKWLFPHPCVCHPTAVLISRSVAQHVGQERSSHCSPSSSSTRGMRWGLEKLLHPKDGWGKHVMGDNH